MAALARERVGHAHRGTKVLAKAIRKHTQEASDAARYLRTKLSEDERTIYQTNLRNATANLSKAKWELQRQERGSDLDGLDTGHMSTPHTFHESAKPGSYTNMERGGLRLTETMTIRLGQAYRRGHKEGHMPERTLTIEQAAGVLHLEYDQVYRLITQSKRLPATKLAGPWLIKPEDLVAHARKAGCGSEELAAMEQAIQQALSA